jgi:predicted NAD/FAD-binding protein
MNITDRVPFQRPIDRRKLLSVTAGGLLYAAGRTSDQGSKLMARDGSAPLVVNGPRKRLAVVGAGMGGVAAAYFSDPNEWTVDLFEKRNKIGGHADSVEIDYKGERMPIDLGAQFFHPDTHPLYISLLEHIAAYKPADKDNDLVLEAPGSVAIFDFKSKDRVFVSTDPLSTPFHAVSFALYTRAARALITGNGPWDLTLQDWIDSLLLSYSFKFDLLLPWLSALIGSDVEDAKISSARSILQTFALAFPKNLLQGASTFNSTIGLDGYLKMLLARSPHVQVRVGTPVVGLEQASDQWYLLTDKGRQGPYDAVIFNSPPHALKSWIEPLPWAADLATLLNRYRYFDATLKVHTDPIYMLPDRRDWCAYNAAIESIDTSCEGSAWIGALHGRDKGPKSLDIFKSWAHFRSEQPKEVVAERRFRHPHITTDVIHASRDLRAWQGKRGLYFSGQYTTGMDLQEGALFSAMQTALALSPRSATLRSFQRKLQADRKDGISYFLS